MKQSLHKGRPHQVFTNLDLASSAAAGLAVVLILRPNGLPLSDDEEQSKARYYI